MENIHGNMCIRVPCLFHFIILLILFINAWYLIYHVVECRLPIFKFQVFVLLQTNSSIVHRQTNKCLLVESTWHFRSISVYNLYIYVTGKRRLIQMSGCWCFSFWVHAFLVTNIANANRYRATPNNRNKLHVASIVRMFMNRILHSCINPKPSACKFKSFPYRFM